MITVDTLPIRYFVLHKINTVLVKYGVQEKKDGIPAKNIEQNDGHIVIVFLIGYSEFIVMEKIQSKKKIV
jgi:hypothetical protein